MKKSTKGAIAAGAAAVLLLGGAGSLAFWTAEEDVSGGEINSGHITLTAPDCTTAAGAHDWQLDDGTPFDPATTNLVPGDTLTKVCDLELDLVGDHIGATLAIDDAVLTGDETLATELAAQATFSVDGSAYAPITEPGTHNIRATISVVFDGPGATNTSMADTAVLDAISVTATQTHN